MSDTPRASRVNYVLLRWGQYNRLDPAARAEVYATAELAWAQAEAGDEVLPALAGGPTRVLCQAFAVACRAAWTPNQTRRQSERAARSIVVAHATINMAATACRYLQP